MKSYPFADIEKYWQGFWEENGTFRAPMPNDRNFDSKKPKFYVLDMFPYPSGRGLHVGHPLGYIATDILSRYKRAKGFNVLHPMGFDAFGLPAEQFAIETGTHPEVTTHSNIENMRRQLKQCGLSIDWSREISTTDATYYKWTQWIFTQLFESWFDPDLQKARPISELISKLEAGEYVVTKGKTAVKKSIHQKDTKNWEALNEKEKSEVLLEHRLAYVSEVPVNWCPELGTVLANEEVTNEGRSERGNYPVFKRPLKQWMLRITAYADRLLEGLDDLKWPEPVKLMQRNWIGRSDGARVRFRVSGTNHEIEVFTTRPDTLFGATYMVLAPEHPLVSQITTTEYLDWVREFQKTMSRRTDLERQSENQNKEGVFTGSYAINPVSGEKIPIWIAEYVLMSYGTGAIMAVPAHDERDFEFAKKHQLPIRVVVEPTQEWLLSLKAEEDLDALLESYLAHPQRFHQTFTGKGISIHSQNNKIDLSGLRTVEAKEKMIEFLEKENLGRREVQYKLRDWLFSRQRYWGEPFPILHGPDGEILTLSEDELPLELPPLEDFRPRGSQDPNAEPQPSLSRAEEAWRYVERNGKTYRRELNTMPQWAGSCWYYLRFVDPWNETRLVSQEAEKYWMQPHGVDFYMGGVEHAVLHLLYARFWHKVLFDLNHVSTAEPFYQLFNQGYIQAYAYQDERGIYVNADQVQEGKDGSLTFDQKPVTRNLGKMGKSLKNSVSPDEMIEKYGCDTFRLYEMYLGPIEQSKVWNTEAIKGIHRFLHRFWRNLVDDENQLRIHHENPQPETLKILHRTIHDVTEFMENLRFNTAIAKLIELNHHLSSLDRIPISVAESFVLMLAPLAPHISEELWMRLGHKDTVAYAPWPKYDERYLTDETIDVVIQINGKKRGMISIPRKSDQKSIEKLALQDEKIRSHTDGKTIRKVIYVPGKLLNLVVSND